VFVRTGYHTQVPEISGKLNGKISFHMGHIIFAAEPECRASNKSIDSSSM
jgi:hypothetical protein